MLSKNAMFFIIFFIIPNMASSHRSPILGRAWAPTWEWDVECLLDCAERMYGIARSMCPYCICCVQCLFVRIACSLMCVYTAQVFSREVPRARCWYKHALLFACFFSEYIGIHWFQFDLFCLRFSSSNVTEFRTTHGKLMVTSEIQLTTQTHTHTNAVPFNHTYLLADSKDKRGPDIATSVWYHQMFTKIIVQQLATMAMGLGQHEVSTSSKTSSHHGRYGTSQVRLERGKVYSCEQL